MELNETQTLAWWDSLPIKGYFLIIYSYHSELALLSFFLQNKKEDIRKKQFWLLLTNWHCMERKILISQNISFSGLQKKEKHTGLKQWVN